MIKIFRGEASEREKRAIELALLRIKEEREHDANSQFGKPILRTPLEMNEK